MADEYQDVNRAQFLWLRLLAVHGEIFVVGDDDQSIFGFRGADVNYIRRFAKDFPAARRFKLEENFRSDGHILDAANAVIAQDRQRIGKTLFTQKSDGDRVEVVGYRDGEPKPTALPRRSRSVRPRAPTSTTSRSCIAETLFLAASRRR